MRAETAIVFRLYQSPLFSQFSTASLFASAGDVSLCLCCLCQLLAISLCHRCFESFTVAIAFAVDKFLQFPLLVPFGSGKASDSLGRPLLPVVSHTGTASARLCFHSLPSKVHYSFVFSKGLVLCQ